MSIPDRVRDADEAGLRKILAEAARKTRRRGYLGQVDEPIAAELKLSQNVRSELQADTTWLSTLDVNLATEAAYAAVQRVIQRVPPDGGWALVKLAVLTIFADWKTSNPPALDITKRKVQPPLGELEVGRRVVKGNELLTALKIAAGANADHLKAALAQVRFSAEARQAFLESLDAGDKGIAAKSSGTKKKTAAKSKPGTPAGKKNAAAVDFGVRLRKAREKKGWTTRDLADAAQMQQPAIVRYETGRQLPWKNQMERLATALGISLATLAPTRRAKKD